MKCVRAILGAVLLAAQPAGAEEISTKERQNLLALNQFSPLETAAAHGSFGWHLGAGVSRAEALEEKVESTREAPAGSQTTLIPRVWLTKGLFYPLDAGLGYGVDPSSQRTTAAGYLQWTIFEDFGLPALGIRLSESRLFGAPEAYLRSHSLQAMVSWGIPYVTFYGGMGQSLHEMQTSDETKDNLEKNSVQDRSQTFGIQIVPLHPLTRLTIEGQKTQLITPTIQAKVSMML